MRILTLTDKGRGAFAEALAPYDPLPAAAALLEPVGVVARTDEEASAIIAEMAAAFADVDCGIITIEHRRASKTKMLLGFGVSPSHAFLIGGDAEGRMKISDPVETWELVSELAETIGARDPDEDDGPPPSTATTTTVIAALVVVFDGALDVPVAREVVLERLGEAAPTVDPEEALAALVGDELVVVADGQVTPGAQLLAAPGLAEAATGDRLELLRFRLPDAPEAAPTDATRLSFLGPAGRRHAALREDGAPEVTLAQLDPGELLALLSLFVAGRAQPAALPSVVLDAAPPAAAQDTGWRRFDVSALGDEADDAMDALIAPGAMLEVCRADGDGRARMAVSIGARRAAAWVWRGGVGHVKPLVTPVQDALAELLLDRFEDAAMVFPDDGDVLELALEARRRTVGDGIDGASVLLTRDGDGRYACPATGAGPTADRRELAALIARALDHAGWTGV